MPLQLHTLTSTEGLAPTSEQIRLAWLEKTLFQIYIIMSNKFTAYLIEYYSGL